jgi:uncharacterized protein (TIRG00374 family)
MLSFIKNNKFNISVLIISFFLLKYTYKGLSWSSFIEQFKQVKYLWLAFSSIFLLLLHLVRSYRWLLITKSAGFNPSFFTLFTAEMAGLFINIFIPRAGELTRCSILKKSENISIGDTLSTVLVERAIDFLSFLFIIFLSFFTDSKYKILELFKFSKFNMLISVLSKRYDYVLYILLSISAIIFLFYKYGKDKAFLKEALNFFKTSFTTLRKIHAPLVFTKIVIYTLIIWFSLYMFFYSLALAIPGMISNITPNTILKVFIMGTLGMAAPVQGGVGAYHLFLKLALANYLLSEDIITTYITITHSLQVFFAIIGGGTFFLLSLGSNNKIFSYFKKSF